MRRIQSVIAIICCYCAILFYTPSHAAELHFFGQFKKEQTLDKEQTKEIKNCLKRAQKCYRQGEYAEAVTLWEKVLSIDAENQKAKEGIKKAEEKIKKIEDFFGRDISEGTSETHKLTLQDCLEIAGEGNLPLRVAKEQITLGKIKVWEARRAFLPSLTLSWAETKGIRSQGKIEGLEYGIEGRQPAFHSGELMYTLAQSKTNLNIAENNYEDVKSKLYFEVSAIYYLFVKSKKTLEYTKTLYEEIRPLYEMARQKYEKEVVPEIEYLNTESKINQIYYKSMSTYSDFELAKLALEQKLDMEDMDLIDVAADIPQKSVDKDITMCLSLAMENRPDLKMGELTVKSTEYGRKIAQAKEMPRVDLAGHYLRSSEVYRKDNVDTQSLDPHRKWYAGLEVVWPFLGSTGTYSLYKREDPATLSTYYGASESKGTTWKLGIFDNLKQFTESQKAEIAKVQAEKELDEIRKKVVMEVKQAFYECEKARIQLDAAKSQREFSEKEVKIFKLRHNMGEIELSELFESITRLMEATDAYFKAEQDLNTYVAALNKAIGIQDYF